MPQSFASRPIKKRVLGGIGTERLRYGYVPTLADIPTGETRDTGVAPPVYSTSPTEKARYLAQHRLHGLGEAVMGLPDLAAMAANAGLADINLLTGGLGTARDVQFPMPSQSLANLATEKTGAHIVPEERMPPDVRQAGANQRALAGLLPVAGPESLVGPGLAMAVGPAKRLAGLGKAAKEVKAVKGLGKAAKQEAITAVSLRTMPLPEAIQYAAAGNHLKPKAGGGYSGAPHWVKGPEDLQKLRDDFDALVTGGTEGADWYERTQNWIKSVTSDPAEQAALSDELALFSAQSTPDTNLAFALQARNARLAGEPATKVRTGQQARAFGEARGLRPVGWETMTAEEKKRWRIGGKRGINRDWDLNLTGEPRRIRLGKKTGIFGGHMDPTTGIAPTTGTNDIWHARALGYRNPKTGRPWESSLTPQQHAFMDAETVLAVHRANLKKLGGRSDWKPGEIQAAPWVAGKGRGLAERGFFIKQKGVGTVQGPLSPGQLQAGVAEASRTYPDEASKYYIHATHETTPGAEGHLPALQQAGEAEKVGYSLLPGAGWGGADERDIIRASQGMLTAPSIPYQGLFAGQFSPGFIARGLGPSEGAQGLRTMHGPTRKLVTSGEALRAWTDAQQAGASTFVIPGQKMSHSNAYQITLPEGMETKKAMTLAEELGAQMGMPNVVHHGGNKAVLTDFSGATNFSKVKLKGADHVPAVQVGKGDDAQVFTGKTLAAAKKAAKAAGATGRMTEGFAKASGIGRSQAALAKKILPQGLGAPGKPVRLESTYSGFDWSKPGSDTATKQMLELVSGQEARLDTPRIRARVLARFDQDQAYAASTNQPARPDIQFARKTFAEGGFAALRDALGKGLLPVAAVGLFLKYGSEDEG